MNDPNIPSNKNDGLNFDPNDFDLLDGSPEDKSQEHDPFADDQFDCLDDEKPTDPKPHNLEAKRDQTPNDDDDIIGEDGFDIDIYKKPKSSSPEKANPKENEAIPGKPAKTEPKPQGSAKKISTRNSEKKVSLRGSRRGSQLSKPKASTKSSRRSL